MDLRFSFEESCDDSISWFCLGAPILTDPEKTGFGGIGIFELVTGIDDCLDKANESPDKLHKK